MNYSHHQYRAVDVETATPLEQVIRLYQAVIRFTQRGILSIEHADLPQAHESFMRAQLGIDGLVERLDFERGGEVAANLAAIYEFAQRRLVEANCGKSVEIAEEVCGLFRELLSAWQSIALTEAANRATPAMSSGRLAVTL